MKILLTGATGYIGKRLLPKLLADGHFVYCVVRDAGRFEYDKSNKQIEVLEIDFLDDDSNRKLPDNIDIAYYLIHSMSASAKDFQSLEEKTAVNFRKMLLQTNVKQLIYLSGIVNEEKLSKHLKSRKRVEAILSDSDFPLTTLRAGIIVGSGSASFEIIRDLVEKLPIMITPKWLNTKSQPISVKNVLEFLIGVIGQKELFNKSFDIGGPDILTYKEMLLKFADVRNLKRKIFIVPVMTPRLSSYWLYFVTSTDYKLAVSLVNSMKVEVICKPNNLAERLNIKLLTYNEAVEMAFKSINAKKVVSSWTDAQSSGVLNKGIYSLAEVPEYGCFFDKRQKLINNEDKVLDKIWSVGGENGWYYGNWLWEIRGFIDKMFGGVGLRRGRKSINEIQRGESLDFWRVLIASKKEKRLLLYAEMKLPGEAWLEFKIKDNKLYQTATFRPLGLWGRIYWFSVLPFHSFIFKGLLDNITSQN